MNFPASAACQLVPQATIRTCRNSLNCLAKCPSRQGKSARTPVPRAPAWYRVPLAAAQNFLEHEMLVAALFRHNRVPQNVRHLTFHRTPVEIRKMNAVRVSTATSPSARKNMSRVWLRIAGTSDATKYSPSPNPTTTGGPGAPPQSCADLFARSRSARTRRSTAAPHRARHFPDCRRNIFRPDARSPPYRSR